MVKRLLVMLFVVGVIHCASGVAVHGQSTNCTAPFYCGWYSFDSGCVPTPPPGAKCQPNGPFADVCQVPTNQCAPPDAKDETCPTCGKGRPAGGSPISLVTGNTYIKQTDVRIPGLASGLMLERTWNSKWPTSQTASQVGAFGPNWRSTFEERIFVGSDSYVKYARSDGSFWSFGYAGGTYATVAPANITATLGIDSNYTYWTLTFQNGERRIFSYASGSLTSIIDRNGNTTTVSYDSSNRLATVTDPGGRHLYFGYANNSSTLVTSVTSDVSLSLSYTYDTQGRLIQVTNPDQSILTFEYDSNSMITAVKDSAGKILESHTYDSSGRGLTSSRAGGVEALGVSYPTQ